MKQQHPTDKSLSANNSGSIVQEVSFHITRTIGTFEDPTEIYKALNVYNYSYINALLNLG